MLKFLWPFSGLLSTRFMKNNEEKNCLHEQKMYNESVFTVGWLCTMWCVNGRIRDGRMKLQVSGLLITNSHLFSFWFIFKNGHDIKYYLSWRLKNKVERLKVKKKLLDFTRCCRLADCFAVDEMAMNHSYGKNLLIQFSSIVFRFTRKQQRIIIQHWQIFLIQNTRVCTESNKRQNDWVIHASITP